MLETIGTSFMAFMILFLPLCVIFIFYVVVPALKKIKSKIQKTEPFSFDGRTYIFKRDYLSPTDRIALIGGPILFITAIYGLKEVNNIIDYFWAAVCFLGSMMFIYRYLRFFFNVKELVIEEKGFTEGSKKILWDEITDAEFTAIGRNWQNPLINFNMKDGTRFVLRPKDYKDGKKLREIIEMFCNQKSVKHKVEDRGLY